MVSLTSCQMLGLEIAGDARRRVPGALSRERERVAGQIARLHQPRKQRIQDHDRLALTGGRQRAVERAPARIAARMLAASACDPRGGWLRVGEKLLIAQAVLMRERGERFAEHHDRPEQEPLGFLAVVVEGGFRVDKARQPRPDRIEIVVRGDLCATRDGAIRTRAAVQLGRNDERLQRRRMKRDGGSGRAVRVQDRAIWKAALSHFNRQTW